LNNLYPEMNIDVQNRSQRAYTIKHVYQQFVDHLYYFNPRVIILHVGIVDCWFREELNGKQHVNVQEFSQLFQQIIEHIRNRPETKLIVVGVAPTSMKMEQRNPGILQEIKRYNHVLRSKSDCNQVFFVDMEQHISANNPHQYLLPDDHHLNISGNALVCKEVGSIIRAIIESELGYLAFTEQNNKVSAYGYFKASFEAYSPYVDNLYNLLGLAIENNDINLIQRITEVLRNADISDPQLLEMVKIITV
jgi:lysophospholipase L1-like esterase